MTAYKDIKIKSLLPLEEIFEINEVILRGISVERFKA